MGDKPSCYNAGDHDGMTEIFHLLLIYILATICFIEILFSIFLTIKELPRRQHFLKKFKIFMVPLLTTDFLIGCTLVLLFVLELSKDGDDVECDISAWRIIGYLYYYATRLIALAYISLLTYRKTREPLPTPVQKQNEDAFTFVINISLLWSPGIAALVCFGFSGAVETNSVMALFTFVYFLLTISLSCACHIMVYKALTRDKTDEDNYSFTDTKYYRQAVRYVKVSFICFLALNVPLLITAFIFVTHSFAADHSRESRLLQDMYLVSIVLIAVEAIGNPVFFVNKIDKVKKGLCKTCSIIIFSKEVKYQKSFNISLQEVTNHGKGRAVAALAAAKTTKEEEIERQKIDGTNEMSEASNGNKLSGGKDGVTFDGVNNDITFTTENMPVPRRMKSYDEAGIEIEEDGLFDSTTNDVTLTTEAIEYQGRTSMYAAVGELNIDFPDHVIFGDWRNHAVSY